jgi:hypothetical protein
LTKPVIRQDRPVSGFTRLDLQGVGEVSITQGSQESLVVEAEDNIVPVLITEVKNGTLVIRVQENTSINATKPIKYALNVKTLEAITVSGAGAVTSSGLNAQDFALEVPGAGAAKLSGLNATTLTATLSGAGRVDLSGSVTAQTVALSGAGQYAACALQSQDANVTLSGAGGATLAVSRTLKLDLTGFGSVEYLGNPALERTGNGLGSVRQIGQCSTP